MVLSMAEIKKAKEDFEAEYFKPDLKKYVPSCTISSLRAMQEDRKKNFELKEGDSLEDLCLHASFGAKPPEKFKLPGEYRGLRVFYTNIAYIRPPEDGEELENGNKS